MLGRIKRSCFALCLSSLAFATPTNAAVEVHSSDRYFQVSGQPVFFLGHYAWASMVPGTYIDHPSTYKKMIDDAAEYGLNYIRISLSVNRFDSSTSPSSYDGQRSRTPFRYVDGKADLDLWDYTFWQGYNEILEYAESRNIVVHVAVFDGVDMRAGPQAYRWTNSYWNVDNQSQSFFGDLDYNNNGSADQQGEFYQHEGFNSSSANGSNAQRLGYYQKRMIERAVNQASAYDNVFFEIGNELFGGYTAWNDAVIDYFNNFSDRPVTINQGESDWAVTDNSSGWAQHLPSDTALDIKEELESIIGKGHPAWMDPDGGELMYFMPEENRKAAWYSLTGGAAGYGGFNRTYMENNNQGEATLLKYYQYLTSFLSRTQVPFWDMLPAQDDISNPEVNNLLAQPGEHYLAFVATDGTVTLNLEAGTYDVVGYNTLTGTFVQEDQITADGATRLIRPQSLSEDWVVYLAKTTGQANVAPTVTLSAPNSGAEYLLGDTLAVTAEASDSDGDVVSVEFYDGEELISTLVSPPYTFDWQASVLGSHSFTAVAYDDDGDSTSSGQVSVLVVAPNEPPEVSLTAPSGGSLYTVGESITVTASASDSDGSVTKVEFYNGATMLASDNSAPYSYTWSDAPEGTHGLVAIAYDDESATTSTSTRNVTVEAENLAPTVNLTGPGNGSLYTVGDSVSISATADDEDGSVEQVGFYVNDTLVATDTSAPYAYLWATTEPGSYGIKAVAYDNDGARKYTSTRTITVEAENLPPIASLTSPTNGSVYTVGEPIEISASATDSDGEVTKVEFFNGLTLIGTDTSAPYSMTWTSASVGSHSVIAVAYDDDDATGTTSSHEITVEAENVAPTVSLTGPANGAVFTLGTGITLLANAADSDGSVAKVEFYSGSTLLGTDTSAPYTFVWSDAEVGTYNLTAVAYDNDDASTTSNARSVTVEAENVPPTVSLTGPANGSVYIIGDAINFGANAADTDGSVTKVEFYNGATLLATDTSAPYSYVWSASDIGSYTLTAVAYDNDGASATSAARSITVEGENLPPTVTLTTPANNALYTVGESISLAATSADTDGTVTKVEFYQGSTLLGTDSSAPYSYSWTGAAAGSYNLSAVAYDNDGATGNSNSRTIRVEAENVAPNVVVTSPAANSVFSLGESLEFNVSAEDTDGSITSVEFYADDILLGTETTPPFSLTIPTESAGSYNLRAVAYDNDGAVANSQSVPVQVVVPVNNLPTVAITAPADNSQFYTLSTVVFTAEASDSDGTVTRVDYYAGNRLIFSATEAPYEFEAVNPPVGVYDITAVAYDNAGGSSVSDIVTVSIIEFVNIAPTITITAPATDSLFMAGDLISFQVDAADEDGSVVQVEYYDGDTLLDTITEAPFDFDWVGATNGTHQITAVATDDSDAVTTSDPVTLVVDSPNEAPVVALVNPAANAEFTEGETISLQANATDSDGSVTQVEFYDGATLLGSDSSAPFTLNWSNASVGSHSLTAVAIDDDGASTTSSAISISVEAVNVAPSLTVTSPGTGQVFTEGDIINISVIASDVDGNISAVEFYDGATLLAVDTSAPYQYSWSSAGVGSHAIMAVAYDNDDASTSVTRMITVEALVAEDTTPPTAPSNLSATDIGTSTVTLGWQPSTDAESGIAGYRVYRDGYLLGMTTSLSYTDEGLQDETRYYYSVTAIDGSTNANESSADTIRIETERGRSCWLFWCW